MLLLQQPQSLSQPRRITSNGQVAELVMSAGVWLIVLNGLPKFKPYLTMEDACRAAIALLEIN